MRLMRIRHMHVDRVLESAQAIQQSYNHNEDDAIGRIWVRARVCW